MPLRNPLRRTHAVPAAEPEPARERSLTAIVYSSKDLTEKPLESISQAKSLVKDGSVLWLSFEGVPDESQLHELAELFELQPGLIDQLQKPFLGGRIEQYGDHRLLSTQMFRYQNRRLITEGLLVVFGGHLVVSVQEGLTGDCLEPVRKRLRNRAGHLRTEGADHLAIALLDSVVDGYFALVDQIATTLDALQEDILERHDRTAPGRIHNAKRDVTRMRHTIWPLRESLNGYYRDVSGETSKHTQILLRDCTDTAVRVMELLETNRELCSDLMDLHLSTASARMNEVMKVLTIITSLFIPPTFIAGIYGMNFNPDRSPWNMPELNWFFGYPMALGMMVAMVVVLVIFLYRRGCFQRELILHRRNTE